MRVSDDILHCVAFLCDREEDAADAKDRPSATAFFVRFGLGENHGRPPWRRYFVTAKHNLDRIAGAEVFVRLNRRDGPPEPWTTRKDDWTLHSTADVACVPIEQSLLERHGHKSIPLHPMVGQDYTYRSVPIGLGDDVVFVGLFYPRPGSDRNLPVVRFGHIAAMPSEPIRVRSGARDGGSIEFDVTGYLVESRSWGGHSGSPAIWWMPGVLGHQVEEDSVVHGFFGLVSAHYDIEQPVREKGGSGFDGVLTDINAGMAVVTPASLLHELIETEVASYAEV